MSYIHSYHARVHGSIIVRAVDDNSACRLQWQSVVDGDDVNDDGCSVPRRQIAALLSNDEGRLLSTSTEMMLRRSLYWLQHDIRNNKTTFSHTSVSIQNSMHTSLFYRHCSRQCPPSCTLVRRMNYTVCFSSWLRKTQRKHWKTTRTKFFLRDRT